MQSVPCTHYAWAEKNTKPRVWSDERHRKKLNGFLTVDVQRGSTRVDFKEQSTSEEAAMVVVLTILVYLQNGLNQLTFLLDNARIHGKRMEKRVAELLTEMKLPEYSLNFWHTPSYSPNLNPAEYLIHAVRRNGLYNVPCTLTIQEKAERIKKQLARGSPMNDKQMRNLLDFIARTKVKRI